MDTSDRSVRTVEKSLSFRAMSMNVGGGRRSQDSLLVPADLARELCDALTSHLNGSLPDVIALQECHQVRVCSQRRLPDTATELAKALTATRTGGKYKAYFVPVIDSDEFPHPQKWNQEPFIGYCRVQEGNAIVVRTDRLKLADWPWRSKKPLIRAGRITNPRARRASHTQISRASIYDTGDRDSIPRALLALPLQVRQPETGTGQGPAAPPFYFLATHLGTLTAEDRHNSQHPRSVQASQMRVEQAQEIVRVVEAIRGAHPQLEPSIVLAGDLNATPASAEYKVLERAGFRTDISVRWQAGSPGSTRINRG